MALALTIGGVTFLMAVIWGSPLIELMRRFNLGKNIRIDGPQSHMSKMGTPAMGGLLIVIWTVAISILVNIVQLVQATEIAESVMIPLFLIAAASSGFRCRAQLIGGFSATLAPHHTQSSHCST